MLTKTYTFYPASGDPDSTLVVTVRQGLCLRTDPSIYEYVGNLLELNIQRLGTTIVHRYEREGCAWGLDSYICGLLRHTLNTLNLDYRWITMEDDGEKTIVLDVIVPFGPNPVWVQGKLDIEGGV